MAASPSNEAKIEEAKKLSKQDPGKAEGLFKDVLSKSPGSNEAAMRDYEAALIGLGELYRDQKKQQELADLIKSSRSAIQSYAKAKTAKLSTLLHLYRRAFANVAQFVNSWTFSMTSPTRSKHRSKSPSPAPRGHKRHGGLSFARILRHVWLASTCRNSLIMTL